MNRISLNITAISFIAAAMVSCSADDPIIRDNASTDATDATGVTDVTKAQEHISFDVCSVSNTLSRGVAVGKGDILTFGIFACKEKSGAVSFPDLYINNERVTYDGEKYWDTSTEYTWPTENLYFYAYYPYNDGTATDDGVSVSADDTNGPAIAYTAPTDIAKQPDILAYSSGATTHTEEGVVSIAFKHILTGLKLVLGSGCDLGIKIKSIAFTGIKKSANYYFANTVAPWSTPTGTLDYNPLDLAFGSDYEVTKTDTENNTPLFSGTMFFVPQTFDADTKITVQYTDSHGENITRSTSLDKITLSMGHTYTMAIDITDAFIVHIIKIDDCDDGNEYGELWNNDDTEE